MSATVKVITESSTGRIVEIDAPEGAARVELDLLDVFNLQPPRVRLACQAKLRPGATRLWVNAFQEE